MNGHNTTECYCKKINGNDDWENRNNKIKTKKTKNNKAKDEEKGLIKLKEENKFEVSGIYPAYSKK